MEATCAVCREMATGQLVSANGKKFHPDCFVYGPEIASFSHGLR